MNEMRSEAHATEAGSLDSELRALREAEEQARTLRQEAIERERARLNAVMAALNVTPEELLGLPARKRRNSKSHTD